MKFAKNALYLLLALCMVLCTACSKPAEAPAADAPAASAPAASAPAASAPAADAPAAEAPAEDGEKLLSVSPAGPVTSNNTMTGAPKADVQKIVYNNIENSSYDPIRNENTDELSAHMFEGLFCWTEGQLTLGQAESYEVSEDGITWTFTMRDDIYWSDGTPVTSHDFKWSWLRELNPDTAAKYTRLLYCIKGAEAYNGGTGTAEDVGLECPDDLTLIVTLEAPQLVFPEMLAAREYMPVPQKYVEEYGEAWSLDPVSCIGNGPFKLKQLVPNEKIVYEKNPYYYNADKITIEELECRFMTDSSVELMAYETGEIQIAMRTTGDNCLTHIDDTYIVQRLSSMWLVVNNNHETLKDVRVRKALAMAIDRDSISKNIFKGAEQPAYTIVPNGMTDPITGELWSDYGRYFEEDVEEAKALLAEAGYPDGKGFPTITYGTSSGTEHEEVAQAICAMWKANLGINAEIQVEDTSSFIAHRKEAGYFDVARWTNAGGNNDPMENLAFYTSDQLNNDSDYACAEYDELFAKATAETDIATRVQLLHDMEEMLIGRDMAVIPLYNPTQKLLMKPEVVGVGMSPAGSLDFRNAYIAAK